MRTTEAYFFPGFVGANWLYEYFTLYHLKLDSNICKKLKIYNRYMNLLVTFDFNIMNTSLLDANKE